MEAMRYALWAAFWQLGEAGLLQGCWLLPGSICVPNLRFWSLLPSIPRASFLMCGHVGRQLVRSRCDCVHSETHTEVEAVNLSQAFLLGLIILQGLLPECHMASCGSCAWPVMAYEAAVPSLFS